MARPREDDKPIVTRVKYRSSTFEAIVDGTSRDRRFRRVVIYEQSDPKLPRRRVRGVSAWDTRQLRIVTYPPDLPKDICAKLESGLAKAAA